jgi:hypothetical protein
VRSSASGTGRLGEPSVAGGGRSSPVQAANDAAAAPSSTSRRVGLCVTSDIPGTGTP